MTQLVTNRAHPTSPTQGNVPDGAPIQIELKTPGVVWDFHERFPNQVKISQNYVELDNWLQWIIKEYSLEDKQKWDRKAFKYLEIGSYAGESLYYVSQILPRGSTIVLVDLGDNGVARNILYSVMDYCVNKYNHYIPLISGDSTSANTVRRVEEIESKYDLVFIDGNHTFDISYQDYKNYGPLGNRVAFHDISTDNITRDKAKYPPNGQPLVSHLWKGITAVVKQIKGISQTTWENGVEKTVPWSVDNWLEIIDNSSGLKPRGFGIIYGGKFG